jgi:triosephosphate isomerase
MHGSRAANAQLLAGLKEAGPWNADVAVCVPFPYIAETALALTGTSIVYGAQDCSAHEQGAYTGEVSSAMLADIGCRYVIVGHSERRAYHAESDQLVADKAKAALAHGAPSARPARPKPSSSASSPPSSTRWATAAARWSWPTSPSGPSAPA